MSQQGSGAAASLSGVAAALAAKQAASKTPANSTQPSQSTAKPAVNLGATDPSRKATVLPDPSKLARTAVKGEIMDNNGHKQLGGSRPTTDTIIGPQTPKAAALVKPKKTKSSQVLFSSNGRSLGSVLPDGTQFRFQHGYLLLDSENDKDAKVITFVRENAVRWAVKEE